MTLMSKEKYKLKEKHKKDVFNLKNFCEDKKKRRIFRYNNKKKK